MCKVCGFDEPKEGTVFYEDKKVRACLAFDPITKGHSILEWKEHFEDLNDLSLEDYNYLMNIVYKVRSVLKEVYNVPRVYIAYLDESHHVHFHFFPRKEDDIKGFQLMCCKKPKESIDFSMVPKLKSLIGLN